MIQRVLKKFSSYFFSRTLKKSGSTFNPQLEVVFEKGKLKLNSRTINYSESGEHTVFQKAFKKFDISKREIKKILILGLGSGGVISVIRNKHNLLCPIVGVEIDPEVVTLSKQYFELDKVEDLTLHIKDAYDFVFTCKDKYSLITMDAFIDKYVPAKFHEETFLNSLCNLLEDNGILFFNYISIDDRTESGLQTIFQILNKLPGKVTRYPISIFGIGNIVLIYENQSN